ncbi:hypothetical protein [Rhizobium sp. BK176]|uniref:hypothetical protein n=1 Tax=Rhizobium sp. BK176 TaxID=2587071 RepID=UPI002169C399|nr:hypothetical protein [Rhizobium sp. BK176]MCS4092601.1 hypothetical protein [Rhizobium sp. BK176]
MMMTDERKAWLRGAYLDRIIETAMHYAANHTHFADAEWEAYIVGAFEYLIELTAEDHGYLREQAGYEAWQRIRVALGEASQTAFSKLRHNNGDVIDADANFALGIGWISLLQHAADRVRTYPEGWRARIAGAKEKFGCCVVHIGCDYDQSGCRSEVERLREEVRLRSLSMCELCGESGRLRLSGFAKTVCDQHAVVMGEFREDDGRWADPWAWNDDAARIDDLLAKGRALMSEYPAETAEPRRGLDPVRPRPTQHVMDESDDPLRSTPIGMRIDEDTWNMSGREKELLIEFGWYIQDAVKGAAVKVEFLDGYVRDEVSGWRGYAAQPLTASDEEFLHGYLRGLIDDEYERMRLKQKAERNK